MGVEDAVVPSGALPSATELRKGLAVVAEVGDERVGLLGADSVG